MRWASALVRLQALTGELQHCLASLTLSSQHSWCSSFYTTSLSFSVSFRGEESTLSCWARLAHLYQVSVPPGKSVLVKRRGKKNIYFEHFFPAHSHLPPAHSANGYKQMCTGCACTHTQKHSEMFKARCCRFETLMQTHSPLPPLHIVNKINKHNQTLSTSFCRQRWQSATSLGSRLSQNKPNLDLTGVGSLSERDRKLECHLSAPWHLDWEGHGEGNGAQRGPSEP